MVDDLLGFASLVTIWRHHLRFVQQNAVEPCPGQHPRETDPRYGARFGLCARQPRSAHKSSQKRVPDGEAIALVL